MKSNKRNCSIIKVVNNDGTSLSDFPVNSLIDKWKSMEYTQNTNGESCSNILGYQENGAPYMNYGCVLCMSEKCYHSNNWKVPEEDKEEYEEYLNKVRQYNIEHKNVEQEIQLSD